MLALAKRADQSFWEQASRKKALELFKLASKAVPGYKDFLKKQGINPTAIKNFEDLQRLPSPDKNSYFRTYTLEQICWPATLQQEFVPICATSGSTGTPTYLPRTAQLDWEFSFWLEYFIKQAKPGKTLAIIGFSLGMWQAGMITYGALYRAGLRGNALSVISTGINKKEIFNALRNVAPMYDHVIFFAYPPFMKDVLDEAAAEGVDFKKIHLRLVPAGETFTERFRDYLAQKAHIKDIYNDTFNLYGCAEGGGVAWETPGCLFIKRLAAKIPELHRELFGRNPSHNPTFAQYNPLFCRFDAAGSDLLLTIDNAVPLVRYRLGDSGGVADLSRIKQIFKNYGIDLQKEARAAGISLLALPFVYVFERNDFTVSFYALQIYPQHIKAALETPKLRRFLTGKFTMVTAYDQKNNQRLEINFELRPGVKSSLEMRKAAERQVTKTLLEMNTEYRELTRMLTIKRTKPHLRFWENGHEKYFKSGIKQKWLVKA